MSLLTRRVKTGQELARPAGITLITRSVSKDYTPASAIEFVLANAAGCDCSSRPCSSRIRQEFGTPREGVEIRPTQQRLAVIQLRVLADAAG